MNFRINNSSFEIKITLDFKGKIQVILLKIIKDVCDSKTHKRVFNFNTNHCAAGYLSLNK